MGLVIDTSVLVAIERGELGNDVLTALPDEPIAIAAITAAELLQGVHRTKSAVKRARCERFVEAALEALSVIPFDVRIARIHAQLATELRNAGTQIGEADLMVATTAVWLDYGVATRDLRSFPRIRGLRVVRW